MAITIITSPYAFVRFSDQHLDDADWYESRLPGHSIGYTLPVAAYDDLAFQFIAETDTALEADGLCATVFDDLSIAVVPGSSLGPTLTPAAFNSLPAGAYATGTQLGVERYRLNDTHVLYYVPRIPQFEGGSLVACGECFQVAVNLHILDDTIGAAVSNVFRYRCDTDYTTVFEYASAQDESELIYCVSPSIKTRVRLPVYLTRPTLPEDETEHRSSDGSTRIIKSIVREVFEVVTDQMPVWAAKSMRAMWLHDDVETDTSLIAAAQTITYKGEVVKEGPFELQHVEYLNYPMATVKFKVSASPFMLKKNNCGECVDYSDLLGVEDITILPYSPDTTYIYDLSTVTDADCCSPLSFAIDYYQTSYIDTISIVGATLTLHTRSSYLPATPPPFVRVKVSCGGIIKYINIDV